MWDWYQIGGRWPVTFLVKADCTEYSFGERSWGNYSKKYPAPEGYMWVSAARKKDICWDVMRSWYPIGVSDIVDADDWFSKNDISIGKESSNWHEQIDTYIDDLDGEDVLVSVDYHM